MLSVICFFILIRNLIILKNEDFFGYSICNFQLSSFFFESERLCYRNRIVFFIDYFYAIKSRFWESASVGGDTGSCGAGGF